MKETEVSPQLPDEWQTQDMHLNLFTSSTRLFQKHNYLTIQFYVIKASYYLYYSNSNIQDIPQALCPRPNIITFLDADNLLPTIPVTWQASINVF